VPRPTTRLLAKVPTMNDQVDVSLVSRQAEAVTFVDGCAVAGEAFKDFGGCLTTGCCARGRPRSHACPRSRESAYSG